MSDDRTLVRRHRVEGDLAEQGWAVYRHMLGGGAAPAIAAVRGGRVVLVAVAAALENGRGAYIDWSRAGCAEVIASVTRDGAITYADPLSRSQAPTLAEVTGTIGSAPVVPLVASAGR